MVGLEGGACLHFYRDRQGRARHIFPPRLRRGTRRTDAPPLLASLRRASVRHPEGASGKRGCALRIPGTAKGRCYPPSVGEITPPLSRFVLACRSASALKKYLRNILEKHCSGRPHNLRWSYHAIRPEGQPQMRNHYYKYLLCILLLIACVLLVILAVLSNNNPGHGKDGTASTHAPSNTSTYWDKDRMESASPAPMPQ